MQSPFVQQLIANCAWGHPSFLIFSSNVFDPLIYYSHLIPLLAALVIGIFVISKNPRGLLNRILLAIMAAFALWTFADLIIWATNDPRQTMFWWSLQIIIEPLVYTACLYFMKIMIGGGVDIPLKDKIIAALPLLPTMLLASTHLALTGFDLSNCNRDAIEGPLAHYGYIIEVLYLIWIAAIAIRATWKAKAPAERGKIAAIGIGICLFLVTFSWGNIVGSISDDWRLPQWGLFGMPVFAAFLAYAIVRYHAFDIKLLAIRVFLVVLPLAVLSPLLVEGLPTIHVVIATISFIAVAVSSIAISRLYSALVTANAALAEQEQFESELLSIASHQLKGPLTAIVGYTQNVIDGEYGLIPKEAADALHVCTSAATGAVSMVDSFLDLGRIRRGTMQYNMVQCDLRILLEQVLSELKLNIEKKGLKLTTSIDPKQDFTTTADPSRIKQVFNILIDNAIKYTPAGEIHVSLEKRPNSILLSVQDTGVGIDPADIPRLFTKFGRGANARAVNPSSSGLGLYLGPSTK